MRTSHKLTRLILALTTLVVFSALALAQTPQNVAVSDQKAGSVLVYPYYNSSTGQIKSDTRISITNTSVVANTTTNLARVHIFLLNGATCTQADLFACLTPNATATFKTSEYDPDNAGYVIAVAVDANGNPTQNNVLIGNAFVNDSTGVPGNTYEGNYGAEAFWRYLPGLSPTGSLQLPVQFINTVTGLPFTATFDFSAALLNADATANVVLGNVTGTLVVGGATTGSVPGVLPTTTASVTGVATLVGVVGGIATGAIGGTTGFGIPVYDPVPTQFAVEIQHPADIVGQRIVVAGLEGNLSTGALTGCAGAGTGQAFNQDEKFGSFQSFLTGACLCRAIITPNAPRVPGGLNALLGLPGQGRSGSLKFNVLGGVGLIMTPRIAAGQTNAWSGIRTLHKTATASQNGLAINTATRPFLQIPIFIPVC